MKKFQNPVINDCQKKANLQILFGLLALVLAILCFIWADVVEKNAYKDMPSLNDVIVKQNNKENVLAYVNSASIPTIFASNDTENAYYFINDGKLLYVAYMSNDDFKRLQDTSLYDNRSEKLVGITPSVPKEVKNLAIEVLKEAWEDENLTLADYETYLGNIALDLTSENADIGFFQHFIGCISLLVFLICLISGTVYRLRFNKNLKQMSKEQIALIDKETLAKNAFYYDKFNLYLTDKFMLLLSGTLDVVYYDDIMWLYETIQKNRGIKTNRILMCLTTEGKYKILINTLPHTKERQEMFNEVLNTIIKKNENILVGYTKENVELMKNKLKDIKAAKKENKRLN